jgi:hypothetical protein
MIVATESHQHVQDEWSGVLNLAARFTLDASIDDPSTIRASPGTAE